MCRGNKSPKHCRGGSATASETGSATGSAIDFNMLIVLFLIPVIIRLLIYLIEPSYVQATLWLFLFFYTCFICVFITSYIAYILQKGFPFLTFTVKLSVKEQLLLGLSFYIYLKMYSSGSQSA
jgi:hypothetical protein